MHNYMKKMTLTKNIFVGMIALCAGMMTSCVEDEGNYDYATLDVITIEGIQEPISVLSKAENIKINPKIYANGKEITNGDPNYTVRYRFGHAGMGSMGVDYENNKSIAWKELTPKADFSLDEYADFNTGAYLIWITVTDNRNGAVFSKQYRVNVGSTTFEGWLVLCNDGADNRVRLDMISQINPTQIVTTHDICKGLPELHNATCLLAFPQGSSPGDQIHLYSKEGAYEIDSETLEYTGNGTIENNHFAFAPFGNVIKEDLFSPSLYSWLQKYKVSFDDQNNAYVMVDGVSGAAYSTPVNTTVEGTNPEFKVAPFVGFNWTRPWVSSYGGLMLFYDITNKRFMVFEGSSDMRATHRMQLNPIPDPVGDATKYFSYTTGKDMLFMQSTRRSGGLVYSILQDASGNRSIYGINLGGSTPVQELFIDNVSATDFNNATQFAFDPRFPYLYYATDTKVYCYNLATKTVAEMQTGLAAADKIVKMKFNLFRAVDYNEFLDKSDDFLNKQYQLIVCTNDDSNNNGGKVTFFNVDAANGALSAGEQYTGFAKIADITYRERTE